MSVNLHVHICPLCRKPVVVRDAFREDLYHKVTEEDYIVYVYTRTVYDRATGEARVREYLYFHRSCHEMLINAIQILSGQAGRLVLYPPTVQVLDHARELVTLRVESIDVVINLIRHAALAVLQLIKLDVPEEIERKEGGYKLLDELPPDLKAVVEDAARAMGYDPARYRIRVSRDLVDKGHVMIHLLLVLQGGVVKLLIPVHRLLEHVKRQEEYALKTII